MLLLDHLIQLHQLLSLSLQWSQPLPLQLLRNQPFLRSIIRSSLNQKRRDWSMRGIFSVVFLWQGLEGLKLKNQRNLIDSLNWWSTVEQMKIPLTMKFSHCLFHERWNRLLRLPPLSLWGPPQRLLSHRHHWIAMMTCYQNSWSPMLWNCQWTPPWLGRRWTWIMKLTHLMLVSSSKFLVASPPSKAMEEGVVIPGLCPNVYICINFLTISLAGPI